MNKCIVLSIIVLVTLCTYGQTKNKKLSLNEAIGIGLKNNPEIISAKQQILASEGRYLSGISLPQPEIGVRYDYTPVNKSLRHFSEKTIEFRQSVEFPTIYFLRGSLLSQKENIEANKLKMTEKSVIELIKTNYYKVLAREYQVKSALENLEISEDFFKKSEIRQIVGEGTNLEKLTAKVQYLEAGNAVQVAKNELTHSIAELHYALGFVRLEYDSSFVLTDSLVFVEYSIRYEQMYKSFLENNSQLNIAKLNGEIASVEKELAWSSLLPNINIAYFRQTRDANTGFYGASFGISVPIWFLFEQKGKISEATANLSISKNELVSAQNEVSLRLNAAFTDYQNNLNQVKLYASDLLPQTEEIYRTARKSYDAGELSYLEYLQAKQTLNNSRKNYSNALFNYYQSIFRIEEITGQNIIDNKEFEK